MQTRHITIPDLHVKQDDSGEWIIEGYASTDAVDSYNEIVDPKAFTPYLSKFREFPVLLLNHEWGSQPIGKIVDAEIRERGLWIKALISKTAPDVWMLINEGILKAFSIGFIGKRLEESFDDNKPSIWREVELVEISVVNVPANREALFAISKTRGLNLFPRQPSTPNERGTGMPEMTLDQVKGVVGDEIKSLNPTIQAAAAQAAASKSAEVADSLRVEFKKAGDDLTRSLMDIKTSIQDSVKRGEFDEMAKKVEKDLAALYEKERIQNTPGLETLQERLERAPNYVGKDIYFRTVAEEMNVSPRYVQAITETADEMTSRSAEKELIKQFKDANDTLIVLDTMANAYKGRNYRGMRTLKYWKYYERVMNQFRKAMDTATTAEGTEWVPTGMSSELLAKIEGKTVVAPLFRRFTMPTKSYDWPLRGAHGTAYLTGESTGDSATKITASTPGTTKVTFTAVKLAMRALTSGEFIEDSIVPVVPFLLEDVATVLARGIDDAILNGDTTASHQDSDVTDATDRRKAWTGLRKYALAGTTASSAATTSATLANQRVIWKLMGECGSDPDLLALIMNIRDVITLLGDSALVGIQNFGPTATNVTGKLTGVQGVKVVISPFQRVTLNASGVYDGSTVTKSTWLQVLTQNYMIGDRRMVQLETDRDIETDQNIVVGTTRLDFKEMYGYGSGDEPVVCGYNMA